MRTAWPSERGARLSLRSLHSAKCPSLISIGPYESLFKSYEVICKVPSNKLLQGLHSTILIYGGRNSNRLQLLLGSAPAPDQEQQEQSTGLVFRTMQQLFRKAKQYQSIRDFYISCSCLELELEVIRDLVKEHLDDIAPLEAKQKKKKGQSLALVTDQDGHFKVKGATDYAISSEQKFQLLVQFLRGKASKQLKTNLILQINLVQSDKEMNVPLPISSSITFVSLAFAECPDFTYEENSIVGAELSSLNQVLLALNYREKDVPYRNCKLTKMLERCLSQSNYVNLVGNMVVSHESIGECLHTVEYLSSTMLAAEDGDHKFGNKWNAQKSLKIEMQNLKKKQLSGSVQLDRLNGLVKYLGLDIDSFMHNRQNNQIKKFKKAFQKLKYIGQEKLLLQEKLRKKEQQLRDLIQSLSQDDKKCAEELRMLKLEKNKLDSQYAQYLEKARREQQAGPSEEWMSLKQKESAQFSRTMTTKFKKLFPSSFDKQIRLNSPARQVNTSTNLRDHTISHEDMARRTAAQAQKIRQQTALICDQTILKKEQLARGFQARLERLQEQQIRLCKNIYTLSQHYTSLFKLKQTTVHKKFYLTEQERDKIEQARVFSNAVLIAPGRKTEMGSGFNVLPRVKLQLLSKKCQHQYASQLAEQLALAKLQNDKKATLLRCLGAESPVRPKDLDSTMAPTHNLSSKCYSLTKWAHIFNYSAGKFAG